MNDKVRYEVSAVNTPNHIRGRIQLVGCEHKEVPPCEYYVIYSEELDSWRASRFAMPLRREDDIAPTWHKYLKDAELEAAAHCWHDHQERVRAETRSRARENLNAAVENSEHEVDAILLTELLLKEDFKHTSYANMSREEFRRLLTPPDDIEQSEDEVERLRDPDEVERLRDEDAARLIREKPHTCLRCVRIIPKDEQFCSMDCSADYLEGGDDGVDNA